MFVLLNNSISRNLAASGTWYCLLAGPPGALPTWPFEVEHYTIILNKVRNGLL